MNAFTKNKQTNDTANGLWNLAFYNALQFMLGTVAKTFLSSHCEFENIASTSLVLNRLKCCILVQIRPATGVDLIQPANEPRQMIPAFFYWLIFIIFIPTYHSTQINNLNSWNLSIIYHNSRIPLLIHSSRQRTFASYRRTFYIT